MKKSTLRIVCLLLSAILVLLMLGACEDTGSKVSEPAASQSADTSDTESQSSDRKDAKDNLPDVKYGGKDFTIFCRSELEYEFLAEELNNEYVNDIIYERNSAVEERFDVNIQTQSQLGAWGSHDSFMSSLSTMINGSTASFDIVAGYAAIIPSIVGDDLFYNWYEIDNVDFTREWWSEDLVNELTINGKMYLLAGDIALSMWQSMQGIFFNKTEAESNDVGDLYQMVYDGKWTFDKMAEIAKSVARNEGNDAWEDSDFHGYVTARTVQVDVYLDAFDIPVTTKNADGYPEYTVNCERTYDALTKLYEFICVPGNGAYYGTFNGAPESLIPFAEGRAMFVPDALEAGETLRNYEVDYGILPNPMFDEDQDGYYTTCQDYFSLMTVPLTVVDTDFVGVITEALCAESYRNVVEDYYEVVLKSRYTRDDDSSKMVDLIRAGLRFNFGYLYSYALDWPAHQLNICINNNNTDFASIWESKESAFNTNLQKEIEAYN